MGLVVVVDPFRGLQSETAVALEELALMARRPGGPVGLLYVIEHPRRSYSIGMAGLPCRSAIDATFARGQIRSLDDELKLIIRHGGLPPRQR